MPLVVRTAAGLVRGRREAGLTVWRGVPYAAPPTGEHRFAAPRPPEPWPGGGDAGRDGARPMQPRSTTLRGAGRRTPMSEDCLTVTVLRRTAGTAPRPVMVFLYGGAYGIGGAVAGAYRGETLAALGDVVFVGLNYRLGAFGWLDLSAAGVPGSPPATNAGLRDQIAALEWVQRNIAAFGGDPDQVTLFGESAGATSVLTLMTAPSARGLFARAIAESPAIGVIHSRERSAGWAAELMERLPGGAAGLRDLDPTVLVRETTRLDLQLADRLPAARLVGPVMDGDLVPDYPVEVFRRGGAHPVPLVVGTNADEGTLFQRMPALRATPDRLDRLFEATVPEARAPLLAEYPARRPGMDRFVTDLVFRTGSAAVATGHAAVAPVWTYRFDFAPPAMRAVGLGAMHGAELDRVFARLDAITTRAATVLGGATAARALTARMSSAWTGFAVTGAMPDWWPQYDDGERVTMVFDRLDHVESSPPGSLPAAWDAWRPYD